MHLKEIEIENFKNYTKQNVYFSSSINVINGKNGSGKTNLLDAIYCLCTSKSYLSPTDLQIIKSEEQYYRLSGNFFQDDLETNIAVILIKGRRKVVKKNDEAFDRVSDYYGLNPVVMISPSDIELIYGTSEERRRWLDSTISVIDHDYLGSLIQYEKILQQRNSVLRRIAGEVNPSPILLEIYNEMLIPVAEKISEKRTLFLKNYVSVFKEFYREISLNETPEISYESQLRNDSLSDLFRLNFKKEIALQRTCFGIHKDDLDFSINGQNLKKFGSQGQWKTFLFALKLAGHRFLKKMTNKSPLLLLDDVCEKLDEQRLGQLMRLIGEEQFGQVFITDTDPSRISNYFNFNDNIKIFNVQNGELTT